MAYRRDIMSRCCTVANNTITAVKNELQDKIDDIQHDTDELEDEVATLQSQVTRWHDIATGLAETAGRHAAPAATTTAADLIEAEFTNSVMPKAPLAQSAGPANGTGGLGAGGWGGSQNRSCKRHR